MDKKHVGAYVSEAEYVTLKELGDGNISEGIRRILNFSRCMEDGETLLRERGILVEQVLKLRKELAEKENELDTLDNKIEELSLRDQKRNEIRIDRIQEFVQGPFRLFKDDPERLDKALDAWLGDNRDYVIGNFETEGEAKEWIIDYLEDEHELER